VSSEAVFSRKLSLPDLAYAASGYRRTDANQVACQLIVEGNGEVPHTLLEQAVARAAALNPVGCMRLAGLWGCKYWRADGPSPRVRTLHYEWDGQYHDGLEFLDGPLDIITGPVAEVIQVLGSKTYLVFRVHHAVADGVGTADFVQSIFDLLNQRQPELFLSRLRLEHLPEGNLENRPAPIKRAVPPFPLPQSVASTTDRRRVWTRLTVPGKDSRILLRTILAVARTAHANEAGPVRILVPVNLRRHVPGKLASANLVGMIRLDVTEQDNMRTLLRQFSQRMERKEELPVAVRSLASRLAFWVPLFLLRKLERKIISSHLKKSSFATTGTVSSIGMLDLERFSCAEFQASTLWGFPVTPLGTPLVILLTSSEHQSELILSANRSLLDYPGLQKLATDIGEAMQNAR